MGRFPILFVIPLKTAKMIASLLRPERIIR